jgi:hypothetical protein
MDSVLASAGIIVAAIVSVVSLILNMVILSRVSSLKGLQRQPSDAPQRPQNQQFQRRPQQQQDRKNGRPQGGDNESRQRGPQVASPVESSLRDINLRLKNAEKVQERARQEVREVSGDLGGGDRQGGQNQARRDGRDRDRRGRRRGRNRPNGNRPDREQSGPYQPQSSNRPSSEGETIRREFDEAPQIAPVHHEPAPIEVQQSAPERPQQEEPRQTTVATVEKAPEAPKTQQEPAPAAPVFGRR